MEEAVSQSNESAAAHSQNIAALSLAALGVVYGDIGTSPLYAIRECFHGPHAISLNEVNLLGVLSLIFWSLLLVISVKYLVFILKADNRGEGGILALTSLVAPRRTPKALNGRAVLILGLFGAALLYADGIITPAISVLSAVEGLNVATDVFEPYVQLIAVLIILVLFLLQSKGTQRVGSVFGPIVLVWFLTIGGLGVYRVVEHLDVVRAVNPYYGLSIFMHSPLEGLWVMGTVFLVVTGGEALYADIGHFGVLPIRYSWFTVVLPSLLLNYFGQGALLLRDPSAAVNPFYRMAPEPLLYPLVVLATLAAVIASQAVITGSFSLTLQAIQLGYSPRMQIDHTSAVQKGQIYISTVNRLLMVACMLLVVGFGSSSALAAAYGVAITLTMMITTILFYVLVRRKWRWSAWVAIPVAAFFLIIDVLYAGANFLKIPDGGWFPLLVGGGVFTLMVTWRDGRRLLGERMSERMVPLEQFLTEVNAAPSTVAIVPGTAIFMAGNSKGTPPALRQNVAHNKVLHRTNVLLTVETLDEPRVDPKCRVEVTEVQSGFWRVVVSYGFMEEPWIPGVVASLPELGVPIDPEDTTYFIGRETLIASPREGLALWRERLFVRMARNAQSATMFFDIPPAQVLEVGSQVEL
ncbi:MAG: potassium transporter Kup [Bdellovibrionales bacterium]|nr:potassium transporter Kup [Bdellovibrionales bacterium]